MLRLLLLLNASCWLAGLLAQSLAELAAERAGPGCSDGAAAGWLAPFVAVAVVAAVIVVAARSLALSQERGTRDAAGLAGKAAAAVGQRASFLCMLSCILTTSIRRRGVPRSPRD